MNAVADRDPMVPVLMTITDHQWETKDSFTLTIDPADSNQGFAFEPGQFNMLYAFGVGEVPISICGDSEDHGRLVHTIRVVGPVTKKLSELKVGDQVGVRGPFGSGWPVVQPNGKDLILMTGGIGLAPLRPVIYYALNHADQFRHVYLLHGSRTPNDLLYADEIEKWQTGNFIPLVTVDHAGEEWSGNIGVVTTLIPRIHFDPANTVAMLCGPEIMMHFGAKALLEAGVNANNVYLSMERNMKCAVGFCGHCQWGPDFVCKDGAVFSYPKIVKRMTIREL